MLRDGKSTTACWVSHPRKIACSSASIASICAFSLMRTLPLLFAPPLYGIDGFGRTHGLNIITKRLLSDSKFIFQPSLSSA